MGVGREAADARVDEMLEWGHEPGDIPGTGRPRHELPSWLTDLHPTDGHLSNRLPTGGKGPIPR